MRIIDNKYITIHDKIKAIVATTCEEMGYNVQTEYRGLDWRADVLVDVNGKKYAFEIQHSKQSLKKTHERQSKYERDQIIGCWLFTYDNIGKSYFQELESLPLFQVSIVEDNQIWVSLKDRKRLLLKDFLFDFINGRIKFCQRIKALPVADVNIIEVKCWKCHDTYHIYGLNMFPTACNSKLSSEEMDELWGAKEILFHPKIMSAVHEYAKSVGDKINLSQIKERYSVLVNKSYPSFGCLKCDAIFGDFFYQEVVMNASLYGEGVVERLKVEHLDDINLTASLPHWCHPGDGDFCE